MNSRLSNLLSDLKLGLSEIYSDRLKGVYLYGSFARNEQDSESDVDVLIVLAEVTHYGKEIENTSHLVSRLSLKYDLSISRVFVDERDWLEAETPLLMNVREEAIIA